MVYILFLAREMRVSPHNVIPEKCKKYQFLLVGYINPNY